MAHRNPNAKPNLPQKTGYDRKGNRFAALDAKEYGKRAPSGIKNFFHKLATTGVRDTPVSSNIVAPSSKIKRDSIPWSVKRTEPKGATTQRIIPNNPNHYRGRNGVYSTGSSHDKAFLFDYTNQQKLDDIAKNGDSSVYETRYNQKEKKTYAVDKVSYDPDTDTFYNHNTKKFLSKEEYAKYEFDTFNQTGKHSKYYSDNMEIVEKILTGAYTAGLSKEENEKLNKAWQKWTEENFIKVKRVVQNEDGTLEEKYIDILKPDAELPPIAKSYDSVTAYQDALAEWLSDFGTQVGVSDDGTPEYVISVNAEPKPIAPSDVTASELQAAWDFYRSYTALDDQVAKEFSDQMHYTAGWNPNATDTLGAAVNNYFASYSSDAPTHAEGTVQLFKDFGSVFKNYFWKPVMKGDPNAVFRNSLQNLIDCVDYVDKGARAIDSSRVVPKYAGMQMYESQKVWQYSGGNSVEFMNNAGSLADKYTGVPLKAIKDVDERALVKQYRQLRKNQKTLMELGGATILINGVGSAASERAWEDIKNYDAEHGTNLYHEMEIMLDEWKRTDKVDAPFERFKEAYTTGEDFLIDTGNIAKDVALYTALSPTTWLSLGTSAVVNIASKNIARAGARAINVANITPYTDVATYVKSRTNIGNPRRFRFGKDPYRSTIAAIEDSYGASVDALGRGVFSANPEMIDKYAGDAVQRLYVSGVFTDQTPDKVIENFKNEFISGLNSLQDSKVSVYLRAMREADRLINGFEMFRLKAGVYIPYSAYKIIHSTNKVLRKNEHIAKKITQTRLKTYLNARKYYRQYVQPDGSASILDYPAYINDLKTKASAEVKDDELYDAIAHSEYARGLKVQVSRLKNALNEFKKSGNESLKVRLSRLDNRIASISKSNSNGFSSTLDEFEAQLDAMLKDVPGRRAGADDELLMSVISVVKEIRDAVEIARGSDVVGMEELIRNAKSNRDLELALQFYYKHDPAVITVGPEFLEKIEAKYKELNTLKPEALPLEEWKAQQVLKTDSATSDVFNPDLGIGDKYYIVPKTMADIKEVEGTTVNEFKINVRKTIKELNIKGGVIPDKAYTKLMEYIETVPAGERSPVYLQELTQDAINSLKMRGAGRVLPLLDHLEVTDDVFTSKLGAKRQYEILDAGGREYYMLSNTVAGVDSSDLGIMKQSSGFKRELASDRSTHSVNSEAEKVIAKRQKEADLDLKNRRRTLKTSLESRGMLKDYMIMKGEFDYVRRINRIYNLLRDLHEQLGLVTKLAENRGTKAYRLQMNRYKAFEMFTNNSKFTQLFADIEDAEHPIGRLVQNRDDFFNLLESGENVPSYFFELKGILDRLGTQLDSMTAYRNFEQKLKNLNLPKDMYYMILEKVFALSEANPKYIDFQRFINELDLQADSWFGENRLALDIMRKNATDFSYIDSKLWGRFTDDVPLCKDLIEDILSSGHSNPRNDINAQMLLYILKDKDAITKLNKAAEKQDVFFLDIETHGLNKNIDAVSQISLVKWVPPETDIEKEGLRSVLSYIKDLKGSDLHTTLTQEEINTISKTKLQLHFSDDPSVDILSMASMRKAYAEQFLAKGERVTESAILDDVVKLLEDAYVSRNEMPLLFTHNNNRFDTEFLMARCEENGISSELFSYPEIFFKKEVSTFKELKQFEKHQVAFDAGQKNSIRQLLVELCNDMPSSNMRFIDMDKLLRDYERLISITNNGRLSKILRKHFANEEAMAYQYKFRDRFVTDHDVLPKDASKIDKDQNWIFSHSFYSKEPVGEVYDWMPDDTSKEYTRINFGDGTWSEARHSDSANRRFLDMVTRDRRTPTSIDRRGFSALDKYVEYRLRNFSLRDATLARRYKLSRLLKESYDLDEQVKLIDQISEIDKELEGTLPSEKASEIIAKREEMLVRRNEILSELNYATSNDVFDEIEPFKVSRDKFILDDTKRNYLAHRRELIQELRELEDSIASTEKIAKYGAVRDYWTGADVDTELYEEYLKAEGSRTTPVTFHNTRYKKQYKLVPSKDPYQFPSTLKLYRAEYNPETRSYSDFVETTFAEEFDFGAGTFKDKYEYWAKKVYSYPDWFESGLVFNVDIFKDHTVEMSVAQQWDNANTMIKAASKPLQFSDIHYSLMPLAKGLENTRHFIDEFIAVFEHGSPRSMSHYAEQLDNIGGKRFTEFEGPFIKNGHSFKDSLSNMQNHIVRWEPDATGHQMFPSESMFDVMPPEFQDVITIYDTILNELAEAYGVGTLDVSRLHRFSRISKELQDTIEKTISPRYFDPKNLKAIEENNYDLNRLYQQLVTLHHEFGLTDISKAVTETYVDGDNAVKAIIGTDKTVHSSKGGTRYGETIIGTDKVTLKKANVKSLNDIYFRLVSYYEVISKGDISLAFEQFKDPFVGIDTSFLTSPMKDTLDNVFNICSYMNEYKQFLDYPILSDYTKSVLKVLETFSLVRGSTKLLYPGSPAIAMINEAFTDINKEFIDIFQRVTGKEEVNVFDELSEYPLVSDYLSPLKDFASSEEAVETINNVHELVNSVHKAQNLVNGTVILNPFDDLGKTLEDMSLSKIYGGLIDSSPGTLNNIQQVALAANRNSWIPDIGFRVAQDDKSSQVFFKLTETVTETKDVIQELPRIRAEEELSETPVFNVTPEDVEIVSRYEQLREEYYNVHRKRLAFLDSLKPLGYDEADIFRGKLSERIEDMYVKLLDKEEDLEALINKEDLANLLESNEEALKYHRAGSGVDDIKRRVQEERIEYRKYKKSVSEEVEKRINLTPRDSEAITSLSREALRLLNVRLRDVSMLSPYTKDWAIMIGKIRDYAKELPYTDPLHYLSYMIVPDTPNEAFALCYTLYNKYFRNLDFERFNTIKSNKKMLGKIPPKYRDLITAAIDSGKIIDFAEDISEDALQILKGDFDDILLYGEVKDYASSYHTEAIDSRVATLAHLETIKETSGTFKGYALRYGNEITSAKDIAIIDLGHNNNSIFTTLNTLAKKSPEELEKVKVAFEKIEAERRKVFSNQVLNYISESETNLLSHLLFHNQLLIIPKNGDTLHLQLVSKLEKLLDNSSKYIETYVTENEYLLIGIKRDAKILIKDDSSHVKADTKMQIELDNVIDERVFIAPDYKHIPYPNDFRLSPYLDEIDPKFAWYINKYYEQLNYLSNGAVKGSLGQPYTLAQHKAVLESLKGYAEGFVSKISVENVTCDQRMFHTSQFDFTCLGDAEHVYKPGAFSKTDPFQNIIKNYEDIAGTVSAERMYISTFFDDHSHCKFEDLFKDYTEKEILQALKETPDQCVLAISKGKTETGFMVHRMRVYDELGVQEAIKAHAIVVPYDVYVEMASVINTSAFSKTYLKLWAKILFFMKVGHLCNPGTWLRNWIDATIKSAGETGSLGSTATGQLRAMQLLFQYNKLVKIVKNEHGRYTDSLRFIELHWDAYAKAAGVKMSYEEFKFMESWLKVSISGGESQVYKSILRQRNDATRRSVALRKGSTRSVAGIENIRNGYDYLGSDIFRFEQLSDQELESLIKEGKASNELFVDGAITELEFRNALKLRRQGEVLPEELFRKYSETSNEIIRIRNRRLNRSPEEVMNGIDHMCSMFLSPMSKVEQVVRLGQYLALEEKGYTRSQIFKSITDSQFNYELKGGRIKGAELIMAYFNFEYHNLVYWCRQIEKNPKMLAHLEKLWSNLSWRSVSNHYENEDIYNNESIEYMMLHGGLPIGDQGMYLKLNPSALSALNWLYGSSSQFMNSVIPPIELLAKEFCSAMGGHFSEWLSNTSYDYEDKTAFEKGIETVPIAGTIYTRYYKHFSEKKPWERLDGSIIQEELVKWAPTIFGAVYRYNRMYEDDFEMYQKKLEKQGKWYDCNRNKVVDISQKNNEGLNNPDLSWEEKELAEFLYHNKVWDANLCYFVDYEHKDGKFVTLGERQFNEALEAPGEVGLNRKFDLRQNPDDWDELCALKWRFHGLVWDKNQRKFVFPEDVIPGMLNRDDLTWEETCYYNEKLFGIKWDSNQNRFVTDEEYIPGGLNDWDNLSWEDKSKLMLYLFGKVWTYDEHKGKNAFVQLYKPLVRNEIPDPDDQNPQQYVLKKGDYVFNGNKINDMTVIYRLLHGDLDASGVLSQYQSSWRRHYRNGFGFHSRRWIDFAPKTYNYLTRVHKPKALAHVYTPFDSAYDLLRINIGGYGAYEDYYNFEYSYNYQYRSPNPRSNLKHHNPNNYRSTVGQSIKGLQWAWYRH